jgi:hypothetical protein
MILRQILELRVIEFLEWMICVDNRHESFGAIWTPGFENPSLVGDTSFVPMYSLGKYVRAVCEKNHFFKGVGRIYTS